MTTKFKQRGKIQPGKTEPSIPKDICPACQQEYLKNLYERTSVGGKRNWVKKAVFCKCGFIKLIQFSFLLGLILMPCIELFRRGRRGSEKHENGRMK